MTDWGRKMFVTPGVVVDGKLVTNDLVDINLGIRILLGHSYYEDWAKSSREMFVDARPAGQPGRRRHPWNQHTIPKPRQARLRRQATAGRCRRAGSTAPTTSPSTPAAARSRGCGRRRCPAWSTCGYVKATGNSVVINLPRTALKPEVTFEWKIPQWSNALERNRARTYFQAYAAALALHFMREGAGRGPGRPHQDLDAVRGARTRRSASASPRRCAACSATTW